jgi:hypothetical protein
VTARRPPRRSRSADLDLFATDLAEPASFVPVAAPPAQVSEFFDVGAYPGESAQSAITVSTLTQTARDVLEGAFQIAPQWPLVFLPA